MKVVFVLPSAGLTGGSRVIGRLAEGLIKHGADVYVLSPFFRIVSAPVHFLKRWLFPIREKSRREAFCKQFPHVTWTSVFNPFGLYGALASTLLNKINVGSDDVIVFTARETVVGDLERLPGTKVLLLQHLEVWEYWNSPAFGSFLKKAGFGNNPALVAAMLEDLSTFLQGRIPDYLALGKFDRILAVSNFLATCVDGFSAKGTVPVHILWPPPHQEALPVSGRDFDTAKRTLLFCIRGIGWKGDSFVEDVISAAHARWPHWRFVGFGHIDGLKLASRLGNRVRYIANPSDHVVTELFRKSDMGIFLSLVEGFGSLPLEAMSSGLPTVTTDVGAAREYSNDGEFLKLVDRFCVEAAIDALKWVSANPAWCRSVEERAPLHVAKNNWGEFISDFADWISAKPS